MNLQPQTSAIQSALNTSFGPIAGPRKSTGKGKHTGRKLPGSVLVVSLSLLVLVLLAALLDQLLDPDTFQVRSVRVVGNFRHLKTSEVKTAVNPLIESNFFAIDLDQVKQRVLDLPWVDDVVVRRVWPRTIELAVRETRILTRWGPRDWLSSRGMIIKLPGRRQGNLPLLQGPDRMSKRVLSAYLRWGSALAAAGLRITALKLHERGAWTVRVVPASRQTSDFEVRLGQYQLDQRLLRFTHWYPLLLQQQSTPAYIDLRYPNGFALGPRIPAGQEKG